MVALGGASGMTEIFGFGKMLDRWGLKRPFTKRALETLEEGGQEALQQFLGNVNAAYVGQYDPNRPLTKDVLENAIIGSIIGGGTQAADVAAERMSRQSQQHGDPAQQRPPEAQGGQHEGTQGAGRAANLSALTSGVKTADQACLSSAPSISASTRNMASRTLSGIGSSEARSCAMNGVTTLGETSAV